MLAYPAIDPEIVSIGRFGLRWYGIMFIVAFATAWILARRRAVAPGSTWKPIDVDDVIFFGALGAIIGGRLGWVLFYGWEEIAADPIRIIKVWGGGMSFHGGLIGVLTAESILAWRRRRNVVDMFDFLAPLPGLGIAAVRVANFINGELWGKPTTLPWGFTLDPAKLYPLQASEVSGLCRRFAVDPCVMHLHASQLYEAVLEGLLSFVILWLYTKKPRPRAAASGLFLICYGCARFVVEFVRVPDENRGYLLWGWVTMGQILSTPMIVAGLALMTWAYRQQRIDAPLASNSSVTAG